MKVVLLAAGRSFRMWPVPDKNFLNFLGKPLIEHQIEALFWAGFREVCVIGGTHNISMLRRVSVRFSKGKVKVREQKNLDLGMAGAVLAARTWIGRDTFLLVSANDVIDPLALANFARRFPSPRGLILAKKVSSYFPGGYLKTGARGLIKNIVEKPKPGKEPGNLVNLVVHYHHDPAALFAALDRQLKKTRSGSPDDLYEVALQSLFDSGVAYAALPFRSFWQPVKYPWHVLEVMKHFLGQQEAKFPQGRTGGKKTEIAKTAVIHGSVYMEDGVRVLDNAVIAGPSYIGRNTVIATNALVRESHIGADCVIGFGSEVARSYLGDHVWTHTNYVGDSVIGNNVSFGAGTVTGNVRLDEKPVSVTVSKKWNGREETQRIDTGIAKLGLMTGDNIRAGINASFMPGVKIGSNSFIGAGIVVAQDIPDRSFARGEWQLKIGENREDITLRRARP